jgi:hypothetical protein
VTIQFTLPTKRRLPLLLLLGDLALVGEGFPILLDRALGGVLLDLRGLLAERLQEEERPGLGGRLAGPWPAPEIQDARAQGFRHADSIERIRL